MRALKVLVRRTTVEEIKTTIVVTDAEAAEIERRPEIGPAFVEGTPRPGCPRADGMSWGARTRRCRPG